MARPWHRRFHLTCFVKQQQKKKCKLHCQIIIHSIGYKKISTSHTGFRHVKLISSTGLYKYILIDLNEVSVQYIPFLKCKCMVPTFHFPQGFMSIPFKGQYCSRAKREQIRKLASIFRESRLPYWLEQVLNLRLF